jgi:hypothetical protein
MTSRRSATTRRQSARARSRTRSSRSSEQAGSRTQGASPDVLKLQRLWNEHIHAPSPVGGADPREQEVALYASWVGSIVEVALARGSLDRNLRTMLDTRRAEGNQRVFRAAGELGEPVRSYVARLIVIEDLLATLPIT